MLVESRDQLMVLVASFTSFLNFTGLRKANFFTVFEKVRDIPKNHNSNYQPIDGTSTEVKTKRIYTNSKPRTSCQ